MKEENEEARNALQDKLEKTLNKRIQELEESNEQVLKEWHKEVDNKLESVRKQTGRLDGKLTTFKNDLYSYLEKSEGIEDKRNKSILAALEKIEEELEQLKSDMDMIPQRFRRANRNKTSHDSKE